MNSKHNIKLFDATFEKSIFSNVVMAEFPSLNNEEAVKLNVYLVKLIKNIYIWNNFPSTSRFIKQISFNNYIDARGLISMLLPHIEYGKNNVLSFDDIYNKKSDRFSTSNLNDSQVEYAHSNIQYSRCIRGGNIKEIKYNPSHLNTSYKLAINTIKQTSNKLFTNWIEVLPLSPSDITNENSLVKNTINKFNILYTENSDVKLNKIYSNISAAIDRYYSTYEFLIFENDELKFIDLVEDVRGINDVNNGLYIGDIYNTIHNFLYDNVKKIKWVLFGRSYEDESGTIKQLYFDTIFDIYEVDEEWNILSEEKKKKLQNIYDSELNFFKGNVFSSLNNRKITMYLTIFVYMLKFNIFGKKISKKLKIAQKIVDDKKLFGYIFNEELEEKRFYFLNSEETPFDKSFVLLGSIFFTGIVPIESLYKYLKNVKSQYEKTYYYFERKGNDMRNNNHRIFEYSRSLCYYKRVEEEKETNILLHKSWESLSLTHKKIFYLKIVSMNSRSPNIIKYYKNIFQFPNKNIHIDTQYIIDGEEINETMISNNIKEVLRAVLKTLAYNGLLTKINPNFDVLSFSDSRQEQKLELLRKYIFTDENIVKFSSCHSFLTNAPYDSMKFRVLGESDPIKYMTYIRKYMVSPWIFNYSLNWIAQLNFYHHYINNRIIFITGSTGVGKTTEMPKLLMYGLKMINYRLDGKIVFTIPRISGIKSTVKYVSQQMGVPVEEPINNIFVRTQNYNFQYKYQQKTLLEQSSHVTPKNSGIVLKFTTDGMLISELLSNILMKEKKNRKENIYDIVVIDEAHEHNVNMDMILSLMKYSVYYNNTIKLLISSATLKYDEGRMRNFYRCINDNRSYPPSIFIKEKKLDRINVDRRMHVAPPGSTTNHKITIIESDLRPAIIVAKILNETTFGDILIFQSGRIEIEKLVKEINLKSPPNVIAIPYHSQMKESKKTIVEKIDKLISKLTIPKNIDFNSEVYKPEPINTYSRCVIVATNIAEPSITIASLKYVIDDGKSKIMFYNYLSRNSDLIKNFISRSSVEQRTGRVGRTSEGTVYRLFKSTDIKMKPDLPITISDISTILYELIKDDKNEKKLFSNTDTKFNFNFNSTTSLKNKIKKYTIDDAKKYEKFDILNDYIIDTEYIKNAKDKAEKLDKKILNIADKDNEYVYDKYNINVHEKIVYPYYGLLDQYDYENDIPPDEYYASGFSLDTIFDEAGTFYMTHPEEININRNVSGTILSINKIGNDKFPKINSFFDILSDKMYILKHKNDMIIRTEFGKKMNKYTRELKSTDNIYNNFAHGHAFSLAMKCGKEYLIVATMIMAMLKEKINPENDLTLLHYHSKSDIYILYELGMEIENEINKIKIKNVPTEFEKAKIIQKKKIFFSDKRTKLDPLLLDTMLVMMENNELVNNSELTDIESKKLISIDNKILANTKLLTSQYLKSWCTGKNISFSFFTAFYKIYSMIVNDFKIPTNIIDMISIPLINNDIRDKVLVALMYAFPTHFTKKIPSYNIFIDINYPIPTNLYSVKKKIIKTEQRTIKKLLTFTEPTDDTGFAFYIVKQNKEMSFISYITPNLLQNYLSFVYYPSRISKNKHFGTCKFDESSKQISQITRYYCNSVKEIYPSLYFNYNKNIWSSLYGIIYSKDNSGIAIDNILHNIEEEQNHL